MPFRFRVQPNSPLPIFAQIVHQIRQGVARGRLRSGDRIPTVRELARELLVNPNTVAKAYQRMEQAGVITTRRGSGSFISDPGCNLSQEEKGRILTEKIEDCLTEAVHLELPRRFVKKRFENSMNRFSWPEE